MAFKLIQPTDVITVNALLTVIYGQPGARKTSMAQTAAEQVITLSFDQKGMARCFGRKASVMFDSWPDVLQADREGAFDGYGALCIDTVGMLLDMLAAAIKAENPKWGQRLGPLTQQGYGVLLNRFSAWIAGLRAKGTDVVCIAHEKLDRDKEETYARPDIVGSNYTVVMQHADLVGYMSFHDGHRSIDFNPCDRWMAKAPPCAWPTMPLPDFGKEPLFMGRLLREAKESMGQVSAESAAVATVVGDWQARAEDCADPTDLTALVADAGKLAHPKAVKAQIWHVLKAAGETKGWAWNAGAKAFVSAQEGAA